MIQSIYKGIEVEMEMHQQAHGHWKCDYTLIRHPERTERVHHGDEEFPTMDLAREYALHDARAAIDRAGQSSADARFDHGKATKQIEEKGT
jgi:hypothetical protein